tara:strand:- start:1656 stop:3263 length:1608 start_codon:yes stop_codon:yes gene_type:complete
MTKNYNSPTRVPFTTAGSDYQKLIQSADSYTNKKELIDYAATDFGTLRDSLISYMKAVFPEDYQNFSESDFGVMFTELVAYMGAVLSFKADALANESYLSTAKNRRNVKKLLQLIGINLKGPTSAASTAILTLDSLESGSFSVASQDRSFIVASPFDGGSLQFTLYKTLGGKVLGLASNNTQLDFAKADSTDEGGVEWKNLALLEGTLVEETGIFNSTEVFKTITLGENPVIEQSTQIYVNDEGPLGGPYTQVENVLSASGPSDRIFDVVYDDLYNATIRFGDGVVGGSPPNSSSYRILYRVGGGLRGNILGATINAPVTISTGITGNISNNSIATGGLDAETIDSAKRYGPLVFKQQDRLVTLEDFRAYVSRYSSPTGGQCIGTAVTRQAFSSANIIDLYILQKATATQLQRATVEYKVNLLDSVQDYKMLTDEINVVDGLIRTLDLVVTIYCDEAYRDIEEKLKISTAGVITNHFSYTNLGFGDTFLPQDLARSIYDIVEVRYSTVDNIDQSITAGFNEIIQLNNLTINIEFI